MTSPFTSPVAGQKGRTEEQLKGEDTGRTEELISLTSTRILRIHAQHFMVQLIYMQCPGDVSEYFESPGIIRASGLQAGAQYTDTCTVPSSAEILRPKQSVQLLCPPQPALSRQSYWAGCTKLPGIRSVSLAVNLTLLLELIIFSWWQSTGMDWTV